MKLNPNKTPTTYGGTLKDGNTIRDFLLRSALIVAILAGAGGVLSGCGSDGSATAVDLASEPPECRPLVDVRRFELRIDISDVAGVAGAEQAVTLVVPEGELDGSRVLMCAFPGAGYSRGYYDIQWQGTPDYSQAEFHAARGWIVACIDHMGLGDSRPMDTSFTLEATAAGNAAIVRKIVDRLSAGTLTPELPVVEIGTTLGIGQSMGGNLIIIAQGNQAPFDGIAVLGSSASAAPALPTPEGGVFDYVNGFRYAWFWEDVDPALVEADLAGGYPIRTEPPPWGSLTIPGAVVTLTESGVVAKEAAAIRTPVFVGAGERDIVADPWAEPQAYRGSHNISVVVVPKMAHMHNFASTRYELLERLHSWGNGIAQSQWRGA